jgi:hypothetical protein
MKPNIDVTLENGNKSLLTKKFTYEKISDETEIRFQVQLVIISMFWKLG